MTEIIPKPEVVRTNNGMMCANGSALSGGAGGAEVQRSGQDSGDAHVSVSASQGQARRESPPQRLERTRSDSSAKVGETSRSEDSEGGGARSAAGDAPKPASAKVSSGKDLPAFRTYSLPKTSRRSSILRATVILQPSELGLESKEESTLNRAGSSWCVIETPPSPVSHEERQVGRREHEGSTSSLGPCIMPPSGRRVSLAKLSIGAQMPRRNSAECVLARHHRPRGSFGDLGLGLGLPQGLAAYMGASSSTPDVSSVAFDSDRPPGRQLAGTPTLRVTRASMRRRSVRSAGGGDRSSPIPASSHQRWKTLTEAMKRCREEDSSLDDEGGGPAAVEGRDSGREEEEGGQDRVVKVVLGNACYLMPVKDDVPKQEEHLFDVSDLQHEPPLISKCGSLEVTFTFDSSKSKMTVHIHRAREIPAKDRGGANSTQVRIMLLPTKKQRFKTKVKEGQDPAYDETFTFNKVTPDEVPGMGLRFRLYGLERMRRERMIGESVIGFASLNLVEPSTHWVILEPRSNLSHGDSGFDVSSLSRSDSASSTQSLQHGGMPELLVGLAYNGTTGRLAVQVIKGSNFRNMAMNRAPDTYVKVTLMSPTGQELQRCKTSVRRGQPNPLFKETFMLQVALFQLPDVTLMVSVYNKKSMKKKEMIGWFSLGQNSSGEEESAHWTDMRESKGEEVCRWHVLLES
ncbi:uncharacterized protein LOC143281230 isoform X1 [Babylonia areolata]|uniref:uncharacterized protein LOC143281230 isoform X1 n=1 Tax=Babylonia areolata TaxID=304850 RepID=UPI003FD00001